MFVANQQTVKLSEPGVGSLDDPSAFVASELAAVLVTPWLVVFPVRRNQFDAAL
jgi:hypothetical protein